MSKKGMLISVMLRKRGSVHEERKALKLIDSIHQTMPPVQLVRDRVTVADVVVMMQCAIKATHIH